jgi:hypothetical protein
MKPVTTFAALNSRLVLLNRFKTNATRELPVMSRVYFDISTKQ